ncbi:hypothetical protein [Geobacter sp. SVR]|uniref:hypothetical protein n=1 Tax=Geobacter sp. SVR TaxID=2495594 RepID=UPI00143F0314|nr:hypothetical protein [Geobacter sp. SVR]BCS54640.1 hypothetical protein GSVR_29480 [Geobacter sp. SVR]GCF86852.1 hypothetical protein GSbR_34520 [Geobacter sp. SVR]
MKRAVVVVMLLFLMISLAGCGDDGGGAPPTIVTQILSDPAFDGDIRQDAVTGDLTITQGNTQSVFAGINPATGAEFRAFLDFPLSGAGGVPGGARIISSRLDFFVSSLQPQQFAGSIPIRIDLVAFQPPTLVASDFSRTIQPALASIVIDIFQGDLNQAVTVDVTPLMTEAQRLNLLDFQLRILSDSGVPGEIEINDTTGAARPQFAPLLEVTYQ